MADYILIVSQKPYREHYKSRLISSTNELPFPIEVIDHQLSSLLSCKKTVSTHG